MTERALRKYHAALGVALSLFIFVQVGSGTLLALSELLEREDHVRHEHSHDQLHGDSEGRDGPQEESGPLVIAHHYGARPVQALRALVGLGILLMAVSGTSIYVAVRKRTRASSDQEP